MNVPLRIAIADDEQDMREYLRRILPRLGHEVICAAENGRQLVDFCRDSPPDLVITDIRMPEMDGIEASNAINALRPIPVILLSAFHGECLAGGALESHVVACLLKPVKQADLKAAIGRCVELLERGEPAPGAEPVADAVTFKVNDNAGVAPLDSRGLSLDVCENARAARESARREPSPASAQRGECVKPSDEPRPEDSPGQR